MSDIIVNNIENTTEINRITMNSLSEMIESCIALDIAPQHTGIVELRNGIYTEYHFKLDDPDKSDFMWLEKLRLSFKALLREIVRDKEFDYLIVEDTYGGENYNTVAQLVTLNTVIDELILENLCTVKTFYRWKPTTWLSYAKRLSILNSLECGYYLEHKDDTDAVKQLECFEDICDAYGMVLSVIAYTQLELSKTQAPKHIPLSKVKMKYVNNIEDAKKSRDKIIKLLPFTEQNLNYNALERSILENVNSHPDELLVSMIPTDKLGVFGLKKKLTFYPDGKGYLFYYNKDGNFIKTVRD